MSRHLPIVPAPAVDTTERLHAAVDQLVAPLAQRHRARMQCRAGCSSCCVDELSVFAIEAAVIVRHHATLLSTEAPHPVGGCAFLGSEGQCRIYAHRPYVCRTQGLPLRWISATEHERELSELRDICELNENDEPLEDIARDDCWTLGPVEDRLHTMQDAVEPGVRVKLRELFRR